MIKNYFLFYLLLSSLLCALPKNYWSHNEKIMLKKDKFYTVWVYKDRSKKYKKILYFRWTLFHNNILTMHLNLEKFNHQFVLKKELFRDTFKLSLFDSANGVESPFALIEFESFDVNNSEATFTFLIRDEFGSVFVKPLK